MSKISLSPNASGTGTFTIASPNSSTDRTLTLPDNTGTILTSASNTNFPTGSVVQVVSVTTTSTTSTTSNTYVDTTLSATITPKSSSNKIYIIVTGNTNVNKLTSTVYGDAFLSIIRGSTRLIENRMAINFGVTTWNDFHAALPLTYLDSPSTTSSTTYKVQLQTSNATVIFPVNGTAYGTITLLEVVA